MHKVGRVELSWFTESQYVSFGPVEVHIFMQEYELIWTNTYMAVVWSQHIGLFGNFLEVLADEELLRKPMINNLLDFVQKLLFGSLCDGDALMVWVLVGCWN